MTSSLCVMAPGGRGGRDAGEQTFQREARGGGARRWGGEQHTVVVEHKFAVERVRVDEHSHGAKRRGNECMTGTAHDLSQAADLDLSFAFAPLAPR